MLDGPIPPQEANLLGPFLGHVTANSIKVWLHFQGEVGTIHVSVHPENVDAPPTAFGELILSANNLYADCVEINNLLPNTRYFYKLWRDEARSQLMDLDGLDETELQFRTLSDNPDDQVDFLIMSCHNPTVSTKDGFDGFAVWADIPQIIATETNKNVRFALLVGDQVYADDWENQILNEISEEGRRRLYLSAYKKFWSNIHYRRVLCSLPAMMMWDDHDITDGWGSTENSFVDGSDQFKPEWKRLFGTASTAFRYMQASRNPEPLSANGFDCCFRLGKLGFVLLDLRTHRNLKQRKLFDPDQLRSIKEWVTANKSQIDTIFFISPVVFSHGSPVIEDFTATIWPFVMDTIDNIAESWSWGEGLQTKFSKTLGDIRDDIRDSWGAEPNAIEAETILKYMFDVQNDGERPLNVVVLSGDIHTSGYASIYSNAFTHRNASSIPHVTSSSVSYSPFNWLMEAIYRISSKAVGLGTSKTYSSQISHHFCYRSVALLSVRPRPGNGTLLKVKYYLEGFPEPQILLFDLSRMSRQENISWVAQKHLYAKEYAIPKQDVQTLLEERARQNNKQALNAQASIVDLMKLLGMDSRLGARKQLALQLGYGGALNGSPEMNRWLLHEVRRRMEAE